MNKKDEEKFQVRRCQRYFYNHARLVNEIAKAAFGKTFPNHDQDKLLGRHLEDDDYYIIFAKRNLNFDKERDLSDSEKTEAERAVAHHVKINEHHPEYWDRSITEKNFDNENPKPVDCSKMPDSAIVEMACDWSAVAIKKNLSLYGFFEKNVGKGKRFEFSERQIKLIKECLDRIKNVIKEKDIHYPKIPYTVK